MGGGGGSGSEVGLGGQDGCERRIEVFVKIQKKNIFFFWGGGSGGRSGSGWGGGQGGCERRIEVFCENSRKKHWGGGRVGGVRMDVNEELKLL